MKDGNEFPDMDHFSVRFVFRALTRLATLISLRNDCQVASKMPITKKNWIIFEW